MHSAAYGLVAVMSFDVRCYSHAITFGSKFSLKYQICLSKPEQKEKKFWRDVSQANQVSNRIRLFEGARTSRVCATREGPLGGRSGNVPRGVIGHIVQIALSSIENGLDLTQLVGAKRSTPAWFGR